MVYGDRWYELINDLNKTTENTSTKHIAELKSIVSKSTTYDAIDQHIQFLQDLHSQMIKSGGEP
jgi:hypothetical protein